MQKLYETYERCSAASEGNLEPLMPICHTTQQAQIEIVLNTAGDFKRALVISDKSERDTLIPCTEKSSGRSGDKPVNHPLCDKLQYIAGDFLAYGGEVTSGFASNAREPHTMFLETLRNWSNSGAGHPKLTAIVRYVEQGNVISDLVREQILQVDSSGKLMKKWTGDRDSAPAIFKAMETTQAPEKAFVRWRVEELGTAGGDTSNDPSLIKSWTANYQQNQKKQGCCMVIGGVTPLALQHPAKLRHSKDRAKLISSNDTSGFTFRGKFIDADQVASVSFDVTQKAHNALRWLIKHQAYRNGDQAIISWAVSGKPLPDPFTDALRLLGQVSEEPQPVFLSSDTAQAFALRLARAIEGYRANLDATDDIVVMALDSATPGRMSITFYRELKGSEFLDRVEEWQTRYAWLQNFGKAARFFGAPAPRDIAEAAYGGSLDEKLRKATIERLLPCIVDRSPLPRDLVVSTAQRAINRAGLDRWEWEKCLGIACGLIKGFHIERKYQMALEQYRTSRDYLYGRLLAIADNIESYALSMTGEKRDTSAARLMQRFADRPASTWRTIETALRPYLSRLRAGERSIGFLVAREKLLDEVTSLFQNVDFTNDSRLSGEFLLGYHCQRQVLLSRSTSGEPDKPVEPSTDNN